MLLFYSYAQHNVLLLSGTETCMDPMHQRLGGQYSVQSMLQLSLHLPPGGQNTG